MASLMVWRAPHAGGQLFVAESTAGERLEWWSIHAARSESLIAISTSFRGHEYPLFAAGMRGCGRG
ncbi:hypothetical protein I546_6760 [Mycobacterium kansasii 732]|nr:hypothetical protein I546_6760 [Mycobacterium kansasii 732]KZS63168.1 hypothetical protein A4G27_22485 [Mycobacterium kansasii]